MKTFKLHIILILLVFVLTNSLSAQCDFFGTVSVQSDGYTNTLGYTHQYILVEDNSGTHGDILDITTDGDFGSLDEGSYFLHAVNYEGSQPAELAIGQTWAALDAYDQDVGNCFEISDAYYNRAVNVCSPDDVCFRNPIEIAVENFNQDAGYLLRYILVSTGDGTIVDFNDTGSFGEIDYTNSGTYDAYALSTNDATLIADLTQGMLFSNFSSLADATCAEFIGPREITVLDNNFVYVADGTTVEATAFCEVDGWTHYSTAANPHDFVFSIYKNVNDIAATVEINVAANGLNYLSSASDFEYSTHTMRRSWSVSASGVDYNIGDGSLTNPVKVRFYYPASEKVALNNIVNDFLNGTNATSVNSSLFNHEYIREARWFKTIDGNALDLNAMTTPELITDAYGPTVVGDELTTANGVNYVELADITGFSGGTYAIGTGPKNNEDVLPVELLDVQLKAEANYDLMSWSTASEMNNDFFAIETSVNLIDFIEIGRVSGAGNSKTIQEYEFQNYDIQSTTQYYRLKQVDFDGSFDYSEIYSLTRNSENIHIEVYPNPFTDKFVLKWKGAHSDTEISLQIINELGQVVYLDDFQLATLNGLYEIIPGQLVSGVYILKLTAPSFNLKFKMIRK
ncbi:MAG: T9SS type A sorting domain-containing protein [Bacteroidales bacterium]|jgi:hypothetical protein|nr:T9SS type A sorting domain-containing protein [Bacteroidales bacterium]